MLAVCRERPKLGPSGEILEYGRMHYCIARSAHQRVFRARSSPPRYRDDPAAARIPRRCVQPGAPHRRSRSRSRPRDWCCSVRSTVGAVAVDQATRNGNAKRHKKMLSQSISLDSLAPLAPLGWAGVAFVVQGAVLLVGGAYFSFCCEAGPSGPKKDVVAKA